jgi:hypothetical protein
VPALVIALESKMSTRGLLSRQVMLEMDCVDQVEMLKATTPADFNLSDVAHPHVFATLMHWFNRVTVRDMNDPRQVACAVSHIRAWKRCVDSNMPLLIAEDDLHEHRHQLLENQVALRQVPNDAHVVSILNSTGDFVRGFVQNAFQPPTELTMVCQEFSGLQCYLLRPDGARMLLQHALPVTMHIDRYVSDCTYTGLRLYRCGHSSISLTPGSSTLSHSPTVAWTLVFSAAGIIVFLLVVCTVLVVKLNKA